MIIVVTAVTLKNAVIGTRIFWSMLLPGTRSFPGFLEARTLNKPEVPGFFLDRQLV